MANAIYTLKMSFMHKADLSKSLAKSIKEDILDNLKEIIKVQNHEAKNAIVDGKKLEKDFKKVSENLDKVLIFANSGLTILLSVDKNIIYSLKIQIWQILRVNVLDIIKKQIQIKNKKYLKSMKKIKNK